MCTTMLINTQVEKQLYKDFVKIVKKKDHVIMKMWNNH